MTLIWAHAPTARTLSRAEVNWIGGAVRRDLSTEEQAHLDAIIADMGESADTHLSFFSGLHFEES